LTDSTRALELVSHDRRQGNPPAMGERETAEIERTRRIRRLALVSFITLAVLKLIAVGI